jgi:hypothetical protein
MDLWGPGFLPIEKGSPLGKRGRGLGRGFELRGGIGVVVLEIASEIASERALEITLDLLTIGIASI